MKVDVPESAAPHTAGLLQTIRELERWGTARGWVGTDPYEGLNATRFAAPFRGTVTGRKILIQAVKRSPFDLRPMLGIPQGRSSAAFAALASVYAFQEEHDKLRDALDVLEGMRCPGFTEPCWGYDFDVQTRVFFYPRGAPNTIATAFVGAALVDAYERNGDGTLLEQALGAGEFFLRHVPQTPTPSGAYFGYLAGDRTPIHNANMLACALLARAGAHAGRDDFLQAAAAGVAYTLAHQAADGSWPYGDEPHLGWVDGFHTGYVLDALRECVAAGVPTARREALDRGLAFYRRALFLADGTPKYTTGSTYPIDIQCVAQGIQTFALADDPWALTVYRFAMRRMHRPDGAFAFQRRRFWRNDTPHIRWGQAPMLRALVHLLGAKITPA